MAMCEKCWRDAGFDVGWDSYPGDKTDRYHELVEERKDVPCTPEEQCGDAHIVSRYKDGTTRCVCGQVCEKTIDEQLSDEEDLK